MQKLLTRWGEMAFADSGGRTPCLIFLHGSGCDSDDWQATLRHLPESLRRITLDFRGHGHSTVPTEPFEIGDLAEDIAHLLRELRMAKAILVGHSLGGMVGMEAARQCPRIAALVLVEGWTSLVAAAGAFQGERFFGTLSREQIEVIQRKSLWTRERFRPELWESFWKSVERFDASAFLKSASIPIFEVYGGMGRTPRSEKLLLVPANPSIRWVWIAGSGHYLPVERPAEVAAVCAQAASMLEGADG